VQNRPGNHVPKDQRLTTDYTDTSVISGKLFAFNFGDLWQFWAFLAI
jgi:hypothetical protein